MNLITFFKGGLKIYKVGNPTRIRPQVTILVVMITPVFLFITLTFLGRASMMTFVFMATSYLVTGQIIPGVV